MYNIAYYFLKLRTKDSHRAINYLVSQKYNIKEKVIKFLQKNHQVKFI
jgi:hypothetical protein